MIQPVNLANKVVLIAGGSNGLASEIAFDTATEQMNYGNIQKP